MPEIVSRADAKRAGLTRYFTGTPCCRAHLAERLASTGSCIECQKIHLKAYRNKHPIKKRLRAKKYRDKYPEKIRENNVKYYWNNVETRREAARVYGRKSRAALRALREVGISL